MKKEIKKKIKKLLPIIGCICLFVVCLFLIRDKIIMSNKIDELEEKRSGTESIREEVKQISKYSAYEFNYTSIICFSDKNKFMGMDIPLTGNNFIATIDGKANIGINGDNVKFSEREDADGNVVAVDIVVPHSEILDNYTIPETLEIYDEDDNIFNPVKPQDYNDLLVEAEKKEAKKIQTSDLLKKSDESVRYLLETHFRAVYGEKVKINYDYIKLEK